MTAKSLHSDNNCKYERLSDGHRTLSMTGTTKIVKENNCLQDAIDEIGVGKFHVWVFLVMGFRWFIDGLKRAQFALIEPRLKCVWHLTAFEGSLITMVYFVGVMLGNTFMGCLSDNFGRRKIMVLFAILETVILLLSAFSKTLYYFLLTQVAIGICESSNLALWTYLAEVWPRDKRHHFSYMTLFQVISAVFAAVIGKMALKYLDWRWVIIIGEFTPVSLCTLLLYNLPESPRSFFVFGKMQEADNVLEYIAKFNNTTRNIHLYGSASNGGSAESDIDKSRETLGTRKSPNFKQTFLGILERRCISKVAEISLLFFLSCWLDNFVYYISTELKHLKLKTCADPSLQLSIRRDKAYHCQESDCYIRNKPISWNLLGIAFGYIPGTFLALILLKYWSRRTAIGLSLTAIAFSLVPYYLCLNSILQSTVFAANIVFITSALKIVIVYSQESFPTRLRATAFSIAMGFGSLGNVLGALFSQALLFWNFNVSLSLILVVAFTVSVLLLGSKKEPFGLALEDT